MIENVKELTQVASPPAGRQTAEAALQIGGEVPPGPSTRLRSLGVTVRGAFAPLRMYRKRNA